MKKPTAIFSGAEERRKARWRIEPRKAKPINAAVATHQRAGLRVTEKRVVLDLSICLRHLNLPLTLVLDRLAPSARAWRSHRALVGIQSIPSSALRLERGRI